MALQNILKKRLENHLKKGTVFITGSSEGIGRATAYEFSKIGWNIILSYQKDKKDAIETAKKCEASGANKVLIIKLDLRKNEDILHSIKEINKKMNGLDVLINNAGVISWKELLQQEDKEIEDQLRINLEGLIKLTKYSLPYVREVIINISSGAGKIGYAELTTYCATKFGVRGFTQALAKEIPRLKIYSVNPGMTSTKMTGFKGVPPEKVAKIIFNAVMGLYSVESGGDIDVWEYT